MMVLLHGVDTGTCYYKSVVPNDSTNWKKRGDRGTGIKPIAYVQGSEHRKNTSCWNSERLITSGRCFGPVTKSCPCHDFETPWTAAHWSGCSVLHNRPSPSPRVCTKFHIRPLLKLPWHEMSVRWLDDITDTMDLSWVGSESRCWTEKPEMLQFTGSQKSGMTEWTESYHFHFTKKAFLYWTFSGRHLQH